MSDNVTLTPRQRRTIAALLQARTVGEAAQRAAISERQVFRWLHDPVFVNALRAAEGEAISEAVRALIADLRANHDMMRATRDDPGEMSAVRLRAAMALDNSLLKWRDLLNFETRLTTLEEAVYGNSRKAT